MKKKDFWHELKEMNSVSNEKDFPELELLDAFIDLSQEVEKLTAVQETVTKKTIEIDRREIAAAAEEPAAMEPALNTLEHIENTTDTVETEIEGIKEDTLDETIEAADENLEHTSEAPETEPEPPGSVEEEIKVLKDEIKQLRNQIEDNSYDIYVVPRSGQGAGNPRLVASGVEPSGESRIPVAQDTQFLQPQIAGGEAVAEAPQKKKYAWIGEVVFYLFLVLLIASAVLIKSNSGGRPITIAGYSAFTVLTSSMESEYPRGSLVVTKDVDPNSLIIGDDITFMVSETTSVTHRIIGIQENFQSTGQRGFETKGVMNPEPDKEIVAATNVVGKVVYSSKVIGIIGSFISKNWPFLAFAAVIIFGLSMFLKWNFKEPEGTEPEPTKPKKQKKPKKPKKEKKQKEPAA